MPSEFPLVSVIVPYFNGSKHISECLKSLNYQDYHSMEIIVVNDGSNAFESEYLYDIAKNFGVKVIDLDSNSGVSFARNVGLESSSGEYLTTIDCDDILMSDNFISSMILPHIRSGSKNLVTGSRTIQFSEAEGVVERDWLPVGEGNVFLKFLSRACYIPCNIMYSKDLLSEVGGYDNCLDVYEDWDFKLRLLRRSDLIVCDVSLGYRMHPFGLSSMSRKKKLCSQFSVFVRNLKMVKVGEWLRLVFTLASCVPRKFISLMFNSR